MNHNTSPKRRQKSRTDDARTDENSGDAKAKTKKLIARNEWNLERYSYFFFPHSKTDGLDDLRRLECGRRETEAGCEITYVEVKPLVGTKAYTNRTYTTLLVLILHWYENKTADGSFRIRLSDIAKKKRIDHSAGKNLKNIRDDLYCLKTTAIDFASTFVDFNGLENSLESVSILSILEFDSESARPKDRYVLGAFSKPITRNLKNEKTNPNNFDSILKINSEIGQILFRYIDTRIYSSDNKVKIFEKNSVALFIELFGNVASYKCKSSRKRFLNRHVGELNNLVLSSGKLLRVDVIETCDFSDVKIVCTTVSPDSLPGKGGRKRYQLKQLKPAIADKNFVDIDGLSIAMQDVVRVDDADWISWTIRLAKSYSDTFIYSVIAEFKEADHRNKKIKHRDRFFTSLFHSMTHKTGRVWIGTCDEHCNKRPSQHENTTN